MSSDSSLSSREVTLLAANRSDNGIEFVEKNRKIGAKRANDGIDEQNSSDNRLAASNETKAKPPRLSENVDRAQFPIDSVFQFPFSTSRNASAEFKDAVTRFWESMKKVMGFTPECRNGGYKSLNGNCICPRYYEGQLCEQIICENNGTRVKVLSSEDEICRCPEPNYITGKHCEVMHCQNGGRYINGNCQCNDEWYTGTFCQYYTSTWLTAIGVPLVFLIFVLICCFVCRLDFCTGRTSRRERRERRLNQSQRQQEIERYARHNSSQSGSIMTQRDHMRDQAFMLRENFDNEAILNQLRRDRTNVVRLEQDPTYNPRLASDFKPMEPPPPYDEAVSNSVRFPILSQNSNPPEYSQSDEPTPERGNSRSINS